jgi:hypothetical protein
LFSGHDLPPKKPSGRVRADDGCSAVPGAFHLEPLLDTDEAAAIMRYIRKLSSDSHGSVALEEFTSANSGDSAPLKLTLGSTGKSLASRS